MFKATYYISGLVALIIATCQPSAAAPWDIDHSKRGAEIKADYEGYLHDVVTGAPASKISKSLGVLVKTCDKNCGSRSCGTAGPAKQHAVTCEIYCKHTSNISDCAKKSGLEYYATLKHFHLKLDKNGVPENPTAAKRVSTKAKAHIEGNHEKIIKAAKARAKAKKKKPIPAHLMPGAASDTGTGDDTANAASESGEAGTTADDGEPGVDENANDEGQ